MLAELHPGLDYADICQLMLRAARTGEDPLDVAAAGHDPAAAPSGPKARAASESAAKAIRRAAR